MIPCSKSALCGLGDKHGGKCKMVLSPEEHAWFTNDTVDRAATVRRWDATKAYSADWPRRVCAECGDSTDKFCECTDGKRTLCAPCYVLSPAGTAALFGVDRSSRAHMTWAGVTIACRGLTPTEAARKMADAIRGSADTCAECGTRPDTAYTDETDARRTLCRTCWITWAADVRCLRVGSAELAERITEIVAALREGDHLNGTASRAAIMHKGKLRERGLVPVSDGWAVRIDRLPVADPDLVYTAEVESTSHDGWYHHVATIKDGDWHASATWLTGPAPEEFVPQYRTKANAVEFLLGQLQEHHGKNKLLELRLGDAKYQRRGERSKSDTRITFAGQDLTGFASGEHIEIKPTRLSPSTPNPVESKAAPPSRIASGTIRLSALPGGDDVLRLLAVAGYDEDAFQVWRAAQYANLEVKAPAGVHIVIDDGPSASPFLTHVAYAGCDWFEVVGGGEVNPLGSEANRKAREGLAKGCHPSGFGTTDATFPDATRVIRATMEVLCSCGARFDGVSPDDLYLARAMAEKAAAERKAREGMAELFVHGAGNEPTFCATCGEPGHRPHCPGAKS